MHLNDRMTECCFRIASNRIHFLKFILEAYDGLAVMSTLDAKQGVVWVGYFESGGEQLFGLMNALAPDLLPSGNAEPK